MDKKLIYFDSLVTFAYRKKGEDLIHYKDRSYTYDEIKKLYEARIQDYTENYLYEPIDSVGLKLNEEAIKFITDRKNKSELQKKAKRWLSRQRTLRRKGKLEQYRIDELNKLGMVWNPTKDLWEKDLTMREAGQILFLQDGWPGSPGCYITE